MGELKDWTGESMTEWTNLLTKLWKFNGGTEPKFWFGDRVKCQRYWFRPHEFAIILGMYWQETDLLIQGSSHKRGWIYRFVYSSDNSVDWTHEDLLEK